MSRKADKKPIKKGSAAAVAVRQNFKTIREGIVKTTTDKSGDLKPIKEHACNLERTLILIKPDGLQRRLVGQIMQRFLDKQFTIIAMKLIPPNSQTLQKQYSEVSDRPFFQNLLKYMSSGPVIPIVLEGNDVIRVCRRMIGKSNPANCLAGTIRGDFGIQSGRNLVHASDSFLSAMREISLWFSDSEIPSAASSKCFS